MSDRVPTGSGQTVLSNQFIVDGGIVVGPALKGYQSLLTGTPAPIGKLLTR